MKAALGGRRSGLHKGIDREGKGEAAMRSTAQHFET